jgi:glucose/mannose-6-phosphate isomerase
MKESILNFAKQFSYQPEVINSKKVSGNYENFILAGMGGSHLAAGILHAHNTGINLYIHRDYGIPAYDEEFNKKSLFIASSYSGNTEEVLDFADEAYSKGYNLLIISTGGKLIDFAKENDLSYIQIPDTGIQPRLALGFSTIALASVVAPELVPELQSLENKISPKKLEDDGNELAKVLEGKTPIIFTSVKNRSIAYNWKIKMNETGKVPAFYNVFPELNHNEMQGYDFIKKNKKLSENFHFIFIVGSDEHPRILKRMEVIETQLQDKGLSVNNLFLSGDTRFEKIFNSLLLADWTALGLARIYETEPEQVPLIEEFKKKIK